MGVSSPLHQGIMHFRSALHIFITSFLIGAAPVSVWGQLVPASVFTDNMVLQREQPIPVWGTAEPGAEIIVKLGHVSESCVANSSGYWMAMLNPLHANTKPRKLEIRSDTSVVSLANVLVGDVWLCSGQSNMQMTLGDSAGGKEFAEQLGDNSRIRLLMVSKQFAAGPLTSQEGKWEIAKPDAAKRFSAVGFSFGAMLVESPKLREVPIGLIDSSFGGTTVEGWIPKDDLESFRAEDLSNSLLGKPAEHYNAMLHPIVPMAIRGVIWYQGESNSDHPGVYAKLLTRMIGVWRREFRNPNLPFIVIQLPAYNAPFQNYFFTWIREQQAKVAELTQGVSLVVTYDTHDGSDLHPPEKLPIGKRAAILARKQVYGEYLDTIGPRYKSHSIDGPKVRVTFDMQGKTLITSDGSRLVRGFQLAGSDGEFHFAKGEITDNDTVTVAAGGVIEPKFVRFAWAGVPDSNLLAASRLPVASFRTDSFAPDDVAFVRSPIHRTVKTPAYELEIDGNGSLRSLGIGGEQFISNDVGINGGSCIPAFLGTQSLTRVEEIGPKQLAFRNPEIGLTYAFENDRVSINVDNQSDGDIRFQITLAPGVKVGATDVTQLQKNDSTFHAIGFETPMTSVDEVSRIKATVPARASRSIELQISD